MTVHADSLRRNGSLDVIDELAVALHMMATTTQTIHHADTKSGMLGAVMGLTIAGASSQLSTIQATVSSPTATALLVVFALSLVAGGVLLGLTHFPRLTAPAGVRWLAFPALARADGSLLPTTAQLCDEAWRQATALSRIALRKQQYLRACLACTGLCVTAFLAWLVHASTSL